MGAPVEFQFEVGAKIDGLTKMIEALDKSVQKLAGLDEATSKTTESNTKLSDHATKAEHAVKKAGDASGHAAQGHDKHSHSLINLGHQFEYAKNGINEFAEAIGAVLVYEAIEKIVDKVKELGEEVLHAGAKAQQTHVAFDLLFGKEDANEYLEYLEKIAGKTPQQLAIIKDAWGDLGRGGFKGQDLSRALAAAGDVAARSTGDQAGALMEVISKLNMVKATGAIQPKRFFKTIGLGEDDAPDKFFAILAKRTGKGTEQLKKDVEAGKVDTNDILESVYWMIVHKGDKLGDAWLTMGKTMGAKITHFKEIPELLFEGIEKSPAFDRFAKFLGDMTEKLGPNGPLGSKLAEGVGKAFDSIATKLSKIDAKDIEGFVNAMAALPGVLADLTNALIKLLPVAEKVAGVTATILDHRSKVAEVGGDMLKSAPGVGPAYTGYKALRGAWDWLSGGDKSEQTGKTATDGIAKGLEEGKPKVFEKGAEVGGESVRGAKEKGLHAHSPSKKFAELGQMAVDGYVQGLEGGTSSVTRASAQAISPDGILPPRRGGGAGGPVTVNLAITVNANGSSAHEIGQEVKSNMEVLLPDMLQAAFEKMALEAAA